MEFLGRQIEGKRFLPYSRPLFDLDTGRKVGRYGLTTAEMHSPSKMRIANLVAGHDEIGSIRHAVLSSGAVWALIEYETEMRIARKGDTGPENFVLCRKTDLPTGAAIEPTLRGMSRTEVRFPARGAAGSPAMFGHIYRPRNGGNDLVVYLHGGPGGTLAEENVPRAVSELASAERSVLVLEYAGSIGGGYELSDRLPRYGFKALGKDMAALSTWLKQKDFGRVSLMAESFGGPLALIAARRHPEAFDDILVVGPLLHRPAANAIVTSGDLWRPTGDSQLESEHVMFGGDRGREKFRADLQEHVKALRPSRKLHFFFGALDRLSSPMDLPPAMLGSESVTTFPGLSHQTLFIAPKMWDALRRKIEEPVYRIEVAPEAQGVGAYGKSMPLQPGMTLTASIILDRPSFLDWLLEPLNAVILRNG